MPNDWCSCCPHYDKGYPFHCCGATKAEVLDPEEKSTFVFGEKEPPLTLHEQFKNHLKYYEVTTINDDPVLVISTTARLDSDHDILTLIRLKDKDLVKSYKSTDFDENTHILKSTYEPEFDLKLVNFKVN